MGLAEREAGWVDSTRNAAFAWVAGTHAGKQAGKHAGKHARRQAGMQAGAHKGGTQKGGTQKGGRERLMNRTTGTAKGGTQKGGKGGKGGTQGGKGGMQQKSGREPLGPFKSGVQQAAGAGAGGGGTGGGAGGGGKKKKAAGKGGGAGSGGGSGGGGGCEDEPGWRNPYGRGCEDYARRVTPAAAGEGGVVAGGWCEGGRLKPEAAWAGGSQYGWPERHCCACGRGTARRARQGG